MSKVKFQQNKNPRVLILSFGHRGGMFHYTLHFASAIQQYLPDAVLIVRKPERDDLIIGEFIAKFKTFPMFDLLTSPTPFHFIWRVLYNTISLIRSIKEIKSGNRFDVIFVPAPGYLSWILPLVFSGKIVTVIHDPEPHLGERNFYNNLILRLSLMFSDALITHGNTLRKELFDKGIRKRVFVIPHGIYKRFPKITNTSEIKPKSEYNLLFFGRIVDYKGLDVLLKSLDDVKRKISNIKLRISGKGNIEKYRELLNPVKDSVIIENKFIPDKDIPSLFLWADIVVLPYKEGTQSGVLTLAYSFKKPVITTSVGAIPEVVDHGKTGITIEPSDPVQLSESIVYLLENPKIAKKISYLGYKKGQKSLSWERIGRRLYSIVEEFSKGVKC